MKRFLFTVLSPLAMLVILFAMAPVQAQNVAVCVVPAACGNNPAPYVAPHIKQVASVLNPATNRIALFGVTDNGRILAFEQRLGQWVEIDQSEAGYVDSPVVAGSVSTTTPHFRQVEAVVNPQTNKIHLFGVTITGMVLQYNASLDKWVGLDQSDAGFLD